MTTIRNRSDLQLRRAIALKLVVLLLPVVLAAQEPTPDTAAETTDGSSSTSDPVTSSDAVATGSEESSSAETGEAVEGATIRATFIVQGQSEKRAAELVESVGGEVNFPIGVIDSVSAELTGGQVQLLRRHEEVRSVWENRTVRQSPPNETVDSDDRPGSAGPDDSSDGSKAPGDPP